MHSSSRLLQLCRITLFTRPNCSLCDTAKATLSKVWDTRPFAYEEIDIMKPNGKPWRQFYEFDTPVIHISGRKDAPESPERVSEAVKLMHRFSTEEINAKMDLVKKDKAE